MTTCAFAGGVIPKAPFSDTHFGGNIRGDAAAVELPMPIFYWSSSNQEAKGTRRAGRFSMTQCNADHTPHQ
jgi:hypothetical protein